MENILWILLSHYICDYPLQGDFLAQTKGKYFYSLFAHSMIYGLGMGLTFKLLGVNYIVLKSILLVATHICIDYVKVMSKDKKKALGIYLYIDQCMHLVIDILLYFA